MKKSNFYRSLLKNDEIASVIGRIALSLVLLIGLSISASATVGRSMLEAQSVMRLRHTRDSLIRQLPLQRNAQARMRLCYDISDLSLSMKDYRYTQRLWDEGLRHGDQAAMVDAAMAFVLKSLNDADYAVADKWIALCDKHLTGSYRKSNLPFMRMMRDMRDLSKLGTMAQRLINQRVRLQKQHQPYESMCVLYKLSLLSLQAPSTIKEMKPWDSYMREGLDIARRLPLKDSYCYQNQFLFALSTTDVQSAKDLIKLVDSFMSLPDMRYRRYYSHTAIISAYSRLLGFTGMVDKATTADALSHFVRLSAQYPYDCPTGYDFFYYRSVAPYYQAIGDKRQYLACLDSMIEVCPKYKFDPSSYYDDKSKALAEMGKWEEAYHNSEKYLAAKDSILDGQAQAKYLELQTQYDVDHLTYENAIKRNWLIFSSVCCLLLIALAAVLAWYGNLVRKKNKKLVERIREQFAVEEKAARIQETLPTDNLSREQELFIKIGKLLSSQDILQEKLGRDELAQMLGTNRTYVIDAIRIGTDGLTVSEYVNQVRLTHALRLLNGSSDISLVEIGERCGFSSKSNFYKVFKAKYDLTPGDYRNVVLKNRQKAAN